MTYQDLYKTLTASLVCAGKKDIRYYLNGVHIKQTTRDLTIETTDGHRFVRFNSDTVRINGVEEFNIIIDRFAVTQLLQTIKNNGYHKTNIADVTIKQINHAHGDRSGFVEFDILKCDLIDGKFPDLDRVLWKNTPGNISEYALNTQYLADLPKIVKPFNTHLGIKLTFLDEQSSVKFTFDTKTDFETIGVIMPIRM